MTVDVQQLFPPESPARFAVLLLASLICAAGCQHGSAGAAPPESGPANEARSSTPADDVVSNSKTRRLRFRYEVTVAPGAQEGPVDIFLPIAQSTPEQEVVSVDVESPVPGEFGTETTYGNRYWHAALDALPQQPLTLRITYEVSREPIARADVLERAGDAYTDEELEEYRLFLQSNRRVPVDGELIDAVIADLAFSPDDTLAARAKRIYDHVVDTMEYKKVGKGWGNGDTYWACNQRYGNCTDFHALFTSLARHEGIPARFEIGFPVPTDRKHGEIGGYHCWVKFYLPNVGWTPIDASEAKKRPEMRETFFGAHPVDRIQFSVGRDLRLGDAHDAEPLNYFVYPHVEVADEVYEGVETKFSFSELR